ncbi:LamG-like jellyroll fold domain-containing protein [Streptomyces sp. GZWMJZ-114]|uniref:LamG-like jellyroll fold domain-containing protein n=1 Tax=unclassified Streptomyces TaxID=2593676 RepID=UPI001F50A109|nr:LamG-like jellyroll fold domain-containing protein [Streptomyces sp. GZWMJZ-114]
MQRSKGLSAALVLSASVMGLGALAAPQAAAVTAPVAFTADDLPTWQTNGIVWALAQSGDTVFVGGTFSQVRPPDGQAGTPKSAVNFAAMDASTGAPIDCDLSFTVASGTATVRSMAVSEDGKTLYVGGYFGAVNGVAASSLAAIDVATCKPRTDFKASFPATVRALAVSGNTVYAGGDFTSVGGQSHKRFAAVNGTTGAVLPWQADADQPGRAIAVTPDHQHVLLGGDFFTVNGADSHALGVVDATTGANVKTYPNNFVPQNSVVKSIATDGTGFYTGNEGTGGGVFDGRIAVDLDTYAQRWRDTCLGATQSVLPYDGVLYSASHAHDCSSVDEFPDGRRHHLLAQPVDDVHKLGWMPDTNDGLGEGIGPRAMSISGSGSTKYLWVGGEFTTVNGSAAQGLTRFATGPDTGAPGAPQASAASVKPGAVQVRWRTGLDLDDSRLTYKVYRNGSATPIHTMTGDSLEWSRPQLSFTDTTAKAGETYTYRVAATDAAGNTSAQSNAVSVTVPESAQAYPNAVLDDGASMYWRYDEKSGPFVGDLSSGDLHGLGRNAPSTGTADGVLNDSKALSLNGTDQQVNTDRRTTVKGAFTLETWFKTTTTQGGKLLGFGDQTGTRGSGNYDKHLYMTDSGKVIFGAHPGMPKTVASSAGLNDGKWHHAVGTQDGSGMKLYVDGKLQSSNDVTGNQAYSGYWHVGGDNINGWPEAPSSQFFNGQIDETAVYDKALSPEQVNSHYQLATNPAPADTIVKVTASEDAYANAGAPSTNYGASSSLAVRGTSAYESYLRFTLPKAPPGTVLKSARLAVKTSTQSGAGSADDQRIQPVTGNWTEDGVTYKNRPSLGNTTLGTLSGATEGSTVYSALLDTSAMKAALGGEYSMAMTSEGTDPLWLWSSEASAGAQTPQLVLTFGAAG